MKHKGTETRNDDLITREEVAALLEIAESLNDTYTVWGRPFWSDGKPVNITKSPVAVNNGGMYALRAGYTYNDIMDVSDSVFNSRTLLLFYLDTNNVFHVGKSSGANQLETKIQGWPVSIYHGSSDSYYYTMRTTSEGIQLREGKTLTIGDVTLSASNGKLYVNGVAIN